MESQSGRDGASASGSRGGDSSPRFPPPSRGAWPRPRSLDNSRPQRIDKPTLDCAEKIFGVDFTEAEEEQAASAVNQNLGNFERLRELDIPLDTEPAITFRPYLARQEAEARRDTGREDQRLDCTPPARGRGSYSTSSPSFRSPSLAPLIRRRQVSSTELTKMYLDRLEKHGPALNCVVTLTEELALAQAAAGRSRDQAPAATKGRCTASHGARRISSPPRAFRPRWARPRFRTRCSTTTPRSSSG